MCCKRKRRLERLNNPVSRAAMAKAKQVQVRSCVWTHRLASLARLNRADADMKQQLADLNAAPTADPITYEPAPIECFDLPEEAPDEKIIDLRDGDLEEDETAYFCDSFHRVAVRQ